MNRLQILWRRFRPLVKYLLILGVIAFISLLFPNNARFKYDFDEGNVWRYEDLVAPFEFPILKTETELEREKTRILNDVSPYYKVDIDLVNRQKRQFEARFEAELAVEGRREQYRNVARYPEKYLNYGRSFIDRYARRGILPSSFKDRNKPDNFVITIAQGNTIRQQTLSNVLTEEKVQEILTDSLPYNGLYESEFLLFTLPSAIVPTLFYNDSLTNIAQNELVSGIVPSKGKVSIDELIVEKGKPINDEIYRKLISFKTEYEKEIVKNKSQLGVFLGYIILTTLIIGVFMVYLRSYAPEIFRSLNALIFVMLWLVVYSYLVYLIDVAGALSAYLIPFSIAPIVIKTFFSDRLAIFTHVVVVLIASFLSSMGYEFTFVQILTGIVAVMTKTDARDWSSFFKSMGYIFLTYALAYLGLSLIEEGTFKTVDWSVYNWIFLNVFLTLMAYPLIPLLERLFGFTSTVSLVELSDMNRPLLRELGLKAPGTFQHSLQVANLSEAAAHAIGADELLVKVAALYHDVGKTKRPEYFIENQSGYNPHQELTELESAKIIIDHVSDSEKMARKAGLPKVLIDFIKTHHGTTRVEYFYRNYVKNNPDKVVDEALFRYPGPRPKTVEETILMIADSLEAASKSLKNATGQDIDELVEKIVAHKIAHGQLEHSAISFIELEKIKVVFKKLLRSINHVRVEYPKEEEKGNDGLSEK